MQQMKHVPCMLIVSLLVICSTSLYGQQTKAPRPSPVCPKCDDRDGTGTQGQPTQPLRPLGSCGKCDGGGTTTNANVRLVKGSGPEVFLVRNQIRQWIPNVSTFNALGLDWNRVETISDGALNKIQKGLDYPSLSSNLIKGSGPAVFLLEHGARRWIPNAETFNAMGLDWKAIQTLSDREVTRIPQSSDYPTRK